MGRRENTKIVFKQVYEAQTYIYKPVPNEKIICLTCNHQILRSERITFLLTDKGHEYYHTAHMKGIEIRAATSN